MVAENSLLIRNFRNDVIMEKFCGRSMIIEMDAKNIIRMFLDFNKLAQKLNFRL